MGSGDYSFNLDADEMISRWMIQNVHEIIAGNEGIDLIYLPRINTVDGITEEHCRMYGYRLDENGWVNFPDWQGRIFRNRPNIRWEKKVHEQITGFKTYATLPTDKPFCILHPKTIEKQVEQNRFYNELEEWLSTVTEINDERSDSKMNFYLNRNLKDMNSILVELEKALNSAK